MQKIKFQRGSVVTPAYLNESQNSISFDGTNREDYFSTPSPIEEQSWDIGTRDKLKDWEIDNSSNSTLGRLAYGGRVLGVTTNTAEIVYGPPSTTTYNSIRDGEDVFLGLDSTSVLPTGSYGLIVEGGSMVSPTGEAWIWNREYLILNGNITRYGIFHGGDQELKLVEELPSRALPFSLLFRISVDSNGAITEYIDLRPHTHLDNLYTYTQGVVNTPIIGSDYTASSWERVLVDTRDGPITITLPENDDVADSEEIVIIDLFNTFSTNPLTIRPSSTGTLENSTEDILIFDKNSYIELVFIKDDQSELNTWKIKQNLISLDNINTDNFVQLDNEGKLPVLDGSNLTNINLDNLIEGENNKLFTLEDKTKLNNLTSSSGTVTSIDLSVPTGFSVSSNPITTSGTLEIDYDIGYEGFTTTYKNKLDGIIIGTEANNVIKLDSSGKLPAVDGSALTNLPSVDNATAINVDATVFNNNLSGTDTTVQTALETLDALIIDNLTLGTAAVLDVGISPNNVVQLDNTGKLPAVDGSALTNLPSVDNATAINVDSTVFNNNLSGTDTTVQTALETLDALIINNPTLGTAAVLDVGISPNNVVQLDNTGKLPAVDGSQLTGLNEPDRPLYKKYGTSYNPLTSVLSQQVIGNGTALENDPSGYIGYNLSFIEPNNGGTELSGYHGGVLAPNGKIYFMPRGLGVSDDTAVQPLVLDPKDNTYTKINIDLSTYNSGVVAPNGKIYCVSYLPSVNPIVVIDPSNDSISYITDGGGSNINIGGQIGGVLAPNGKIYYVPYNSSEILIIDPTNETVTTVETGNVSFVGGVLGPNGKIYCPPYFSPAGQILVIDPTNDTFTTIGDGSLTGYHCGTLAPNGKIYCIPFQSGQILVIDPNNNDNITFITGADLNGYHGGVLAPNGKIYCIPRDTTLGQIMEINPDDNSIKKFGSGLNGYIGGVLAPSGKIYCVPKTATNILVIDGVSDGEHWWALSNYVNNL